MAAKFFTGLPLDGPDPECVKGHGSSALAMAAGAAAPRPSGDHSHRGRVPVPVAIGPRPADNDRAVPDRACNQSPLAGLTPAR
jgi:hypothetical protein